MHTKKPRLMGHEISKNKRYFLGALFCMLIVVAVDFITPLVLAETLDVYLGAGERTRRAICPAL